ncbi:class A beta-lactamase [Loktanella agnita]|uniref:class A beta-lactamase n=1 Tax=Loktanella agnita TaxID=287097 RepID=UPI00398A0D44
MHIPSSLFHALAALALCLPWPAGQAAAQTAEQQALTATVARLESTMHARIGVFIKHAGTDWQWGHRETERFLMASTFKSLLCGAVLDRVDHGTLSLDESLLVRPEEIHGHAPVTRDQTGEPLSIGTLCRATLDMSDNGAANLLIDRLGGTAEVTAYMRRIGDTVTRLDRKEPDLNSFVPGDPRDTTSPVAMATSWETMLTGDVLSHESRAHLANWMGDGGVTAALIRPHVPAGWHVSDKSGGGDNTRSLVAMLTSENGSRYFVALYVSDTLVDWDTRNAAISELGAAAVAYIQAHHAVTLR